MQSEDFEKQVRRLKDQAAPGCPGNLEANVLRRVRLEKDASGEGILDWLFVLIPKTGFVSAVFVLVAITSVSVATVSTLTSSRSGEDSLKASHALDFDFVTRTELVTFDR